MKYNICFLKSRWPKFSTVFIQYYNIGNVKIWRRFAASHLEKAGKERKIHTLHIIMEKQCSGVAFVAIFSLLNMCEWHKRFLSTIA